MTKVLNPEKHQGIVQGVLRIYQNFIALLDEWQRDKLTGLLNRQTFDYEIMQIISKSVRRSSQVALYPGTRRRTPDENFIHFMAILDIDHFKQINDTFGHVYGDEVLILLSNLLKASFRREDDLLFRYGGEEFIIVLCVPSRDSAATALERFRRAVAEYPFPRVGQVTVSIGYVQISSNQVPAVVTGRADLALYYAKGHGRNAIFSYEELFATGKVKEPEKTGESKLRGA